MSHLTIHSGSGATATVAWTPAGYDAVAWHGGTRASLIDSVDDARSLWAAAVWLSDQLGYGNEGDVGEVLARLICGETVEDIGGGAPGEIAGIIEALRELRR